MSILTEHFNLQNSLLSLEVVDHCGKWAFYTQYLTISHIKESTFTQKLRHTMYTRFDKSLNATVHRAHTDHKIYGDLNEI